MVSARNAQVELGIIDYRIRDKRSGCAPFVVGRGPKWPKMVQKEEIMYAKLILIVKNLHI